MWFVALCSPAARITMEESPILKVKKKGRLGALQADSPTRQNRNSTSTLYIRDTVSKPNMTTLVKCIAIALQSCVERGCGEEEPKLEDIFDERAHPISEDDVDVEEMPEVNTIFLFLAVMFNTEQLSAESGIMMLAYIDRIIATSGLTLHATNWRRVVLSTLLLATKVWEDEEVWNADWQSVFPCITSQDLGRMERKLLNLLQFNVSLKASEYAKYYFELRTLAEKQDQIFPAEPLDREGALKLEARSQQREEAMIAGAAPSNRSKSMNVGKVKASPMILN